MADIDLDEYDARPTTDAQRTDGHGSRGNDRRGAGLAGFFSRIANLFGAVVSIALIAGLAFWGYKLTMRDVAGVPVIQALEGPSRIAPENPGGELAQHQGLAVNTVAAVGEAADPASRLTLAPPPSGLAEEDLPLADLLPEAALTTSAEAGEPAPEAAASALPTRLDPTDQSIDPEARARALAEALSTDVEPLSGDEVALFAPEPLPDGSDTRIEGEGAAAAIAGVLPASVPGVRNSVRPVPRPNVDFAALSAARSQRQAATPPSVTEVDPATLPEGTRLVQIGAFDDAETARKEWDKVQGRFGALMADKGRVIQPAESGGRTFYRLRVHGFADVADSRRFCAALLAEATPCIPAQVR